MDAKRAQEIASSETMANVSYNGGKIYIEHVDQDTGNATVHPLEKPEFKQNVSVDDLTEQ
ncbi:H-type small acid-soluble spore protein [Aquibacillus rhizosphaerae]|uniref:Small, acid-soluble spore protein H n=1 Tax=Aquibacillus rhizosphaerae TaxID=3051431 RepID=A0ABT7L305_9BACI|nr:H-type small acid-soluble spore protein [Aquibacillus sp. LR5S19]MDL4839779.1 H-type small acid-soluble spore protein [Aquibacillus sp. LR5S19]